MRFTVTAVVFPHKGGPSNGLRSVCNRRGGKKQGSLLRVCRHISDQENHYGSRVSFKTALTFFCHPNPGLLWRWYHLNIGKRTQMVSSLFPFGSPLSSKCKECRGNCASGIWLSTVLNIHTKDRFISHWSIWIKNELLMDGILSLPAASTLPEKHRFWNPHDIRNCRPWNTTRAEAHNVRQIIQNNK